MELNQNKTETPRNIVNGNEKIIPEGADENLDYLYPSGNRITHRSMWFKGSRNRCFRAVNAA
tara:strand:+ start:398 stop:583 length:186 start_codon:yes stop_codon:yes gene_type:complete